MCAALQAALFPTAHLGSWSGRFTFWEKPLGIIQLQPFWEASIGGSALPRPALHGAVSPGSLETQSHPICSVSPVATGPAPQLLRRAVPSTEEGSSVGTAGPGPVGRRVPLGGPGAQSAWGRRISRATISKLPGDPSHPNFHGDNTGLPAARCNCCLTCRALRVDF